jgi:hypothetical protein
MRLQVGSGDRTADLRWDGWVTLDADPAANPNIVAVVPPFPPEVATYAGQWREIQAIRVIEHMYLHQAERFLDECYFMLAIGGRLVLEQPDLEYAARALLGLVEVPDSKRDDALFFHMYAIYGDQRRQNPLYQHLWGWTPDSLKAAVLKAGFQQVDIQPALFHWPWRDFRIEAVKHA